MQDSTVMQRKRDRTRLSYRQRRALEGVPEGMVVLRLDRVVAKARQLGLGTTRPDGLVVCTRDEFEVVRRALQQESVARQKTPERAEGRIALAESYYRQLIAEGRSEEYARARVAGLDGFDRAEDRPESVPVAPLSSEWRRAALDAYATNRRGDL